MTSGVVFVLLVLSNVIHTFGIPNSSDFGNGTKKVKRWASGFQDIAVDYPEFDDSFGDNQLEVARPLSTSPGSVVFYRPGSRRPSGAVTRTIFNPPSGFIPRIFAAAKAAIATLTGPQTVLSRTTYLSPPRPGISAVQVPQSTLVPSQESATNTAAAAAAAAVAAVTRSIYEAAGLRGNGFYEKGNYLQPTTYNNYGYWPEPTRSPWTTLQPPEITFRIPHESWDRPKPHITDTYGPPTWFNQNPVITIDTPRNPWVENGWYDNRNQWNGNRHHINWVQDTRIKDWAEEKRMKNFGRAGGYGGYASATADSPPNGDSFADAKITANGASAVAATVWDLGGGITASKRTKTEVHRAVDDLERDERVTPKENYKRDRFTGRIDDDLDDKTSDEPKCNNDRGCLPKTDSERLRRLFPSRRKL